MTVKTEKIIKATIYNESGQISLKQVDNCLIEIITCDNFSDKESMIIVSMNELEEAIEFITRSQGD